MELQSASAVVQAAVDRSRAYVPLAQKAIEAELQVAGTDLPEAALKCDGKYVGKVRDVYRCEDVVVMVSTDRQSAFDRQLTRVPFKGQVLTGTSQWWFEQTTDIVPNDCVGFPHPNAKVGMKCTVFPVEFVMRGYITGSTNTSMWTHYNKGVRNYCGHALPDGLVKNQKLAANLLTPTTKDDVHDELISAEEVVSSGRMTQAQWDYCAQAAHRLFEFGQEVAAARGLILVDTKYEFGLDEAGTIRLIDEIHTPDSSRYWIADTYEERMAAGKAPENIDKEFLRLWFREHCDPYKDEVLPEAPAELVAELSRRYIMLYEMITGNEFVFPDGVSADQPIGKDAVMADLNEKVVAFLEERRKLAR
eukprot:scaffold770_cov255-Pinguiococcus_pyrenoidosus.AAC.64